MSEISLHFIFQTAFCAKLRLVIYSQLLQQVAERFGRIEIQDNPAFFVVNGFDFSVDTQPFSQQIVKAADVGSGIFFGFGLFVLMGNLAAALDFAH